MTTISTVLILQSKDSWKLEDLDSIKINYEFSDKLLTFLKKLGPLPKVYRQIMK